MEKDKLHDLVAAAVINSILKDIVSESQGEETVREISELARLRRRIEECMDKPAVISIEDVDRFNRLVSKHFPGRGERDAEADMDE